MTGPLSSLRVLDFSRLLPGPFATMMLADLGADVVRVESPDLPDPVRAVPPARGGSSAWHEVLNRNKRSLALDLKHPVAAGVVRRLVQRHDIVLDQFRPGVMDRLGIGYDALRAANPRVIHCALTGYGQNGPYRDRAGHDNNYLALSGAMSHSGRRGAGPPPLGLQVADIGGGAFGAVTALLAAVVHRERTGEGQFIDVSMLDVMLGWQAHLMSQFLVAGHVPRPESEILNGGGPYDFYETGDGRHLAVGSLEPKFWQAFCQTIGRPDLIPLREDPDPAARAALKDQIRAVIAGRTLADWMRAFGDVDACVEPVLTVPEALEHPQVRARGVIVDVPALGGGAQRQVASPFRFSATSAAYRHTGPAPGAHSDQVLEEAGFSAAEIHELRESGALA